MDHTVESSYKKWQLPSFLGLDAALFALFWGQCYVLLLDIPVVTEEPFLFLAVSVSLTYILSRLGRAFRGQPAFYSAFYVNQMGLISVLAIAVIMALLWIALYYVSLHFLRFTTLPIAFLLLSYLPLVRESRLCSLALRSLALSLAIITPAFYFMVTVSPIHGLFYPPIYYLALLIFAFELTKASWSHPRSDVRARYSLIATVTLLFVLLASLTSANTGAFYERGMYFSFVVGCAVVEILSRLRPYIELQTLYAMSWLIFSLSAVLSVLLFEGWFN